MAFRARFIPTNPGKYVGDVDKIFARSSWEVTVMKYFDQRSDVVRWGSEELAIPYLSPADNRVHNYFPDFFVEYYDKDGKLQREIVEVKPLHETEQKAAKNERSQAALQVNHAKWRYAAEFCESKGMKFRVITEKAIFHQGQKKQRKKEIVNG